MLRLDIDERRPPRNGSCECRHSFRPRHLVECWLRLGRKPTEVSEMLRLFIFSCFSFAVIAGAAHASADVLVDVEIHEDMPNDAPWTFARGPTTKYAQAAFAWNALPKKYLRGGIIGDRSNPFTLRATARINFPTGEYDLLLRSKDLARLLVDGEVVIEQPKRLSKNADGHEVTPNLLPAVRPNHRPPPPGHQEFTLKHPLGGTHEIVLEAVVGGKGLRADLGDLCVAVAGPNEELFRILSPDRLESFPLTDEAWAAWSGRANAHVHQLDTEHRRKAASADDEYWQKRHQQARHHYEDQPHVVVPAVESQDQLANPIDRFVAVRLEEKSLRAAPLGSDMEFLRRVTLDTVGVVPTLSEIERFTTDPPSDRREQLIDRLLGDPRWADHWVSYWQDVFAENPNILKASLNNTGPFRWWIYESFFDNKPMDRFATDLILMQGSKYSGGPAGFGMATQNDVPEANKALILSKAFLAANLYCARCHDSPTNDYTQKQLFSMAAMLRREALALPQTSTVELEGVGREPLIQVSLKPGMQILPHWPLDELGSDELLAGVLRNASDPREWLAAIVTAPSNERFANVTVNRIWHRYAGRGLVDPIDDWHDATPSHPELLNYLSRELVTHDYDIKHIARLILTSQTYQRQVLAEDTDQRHLGERWFASATRRRMSAEQVFDSLFSVAGKKVHAERLTMDPEGRRPINSFLNLGIPRRAWQFSSLSNERDRPALSLPVAQSANDLLKAYGWREARQDAVSVRDETITPLQPLVLAHGTIGRRLVGLSDDHAVTELCLHDVSLDELVDTLFLSFFTRRPSDYERKVTTEFLDSGYQDRVVAGAVAIKDAHAWQRHPVSWSNHLHPKSSEIMLRIENRAREADLPTARLQQDWRERMEDILWALVNNPEFMFIP